MDIDCFSVDWLIDWFFFVERIELSGFDGVDRIIRIRWVQRTEVLPVTWTGMIRHSLTAVPGIALFNASPVFTTMERKWTYCVSVVSNNNVQSFHKTAYVITFVVLLLTIFWTARTDGLHLTAKQLTTTSQPDAIGPQKWIIGTQIAIMHPTSISSRVFPVITAMKKKTAALSIDFVNSTTMDQEGSYIHTSILIHIRNHYFGRFMCLLRAVDPFYGSYDVTTSWRST